VYAADKKLSAEHDQEAKGRAYTKNLIKSGEWEYTPAGLRKIFH